MNSEAMVLDTPRISMRVSVCWSIGQLVRGSIGPSSFRKIVKNGQNLLKKNMKRKWEDNLDIFTPSGANLNVLGPIISEL